MARTPRRAARNSTAARAAAPLLLVLVVVLQLASGAGAAASGADCGASRELYVAAKGCPAGATICLLFTDATDGRRRSGCWDITSREAALSLRGAAVQLDETQPAYVRWTAGTADPGTPTSGSPALKYSTDRAPCDSSERSQACCDTPLKNTAIFNCEGDDGRGGAAKGDDGRGGAARGAGGVDAGGGGGSGDGAAGDSSKGGPASATGDDGSFGLSVSAPAGGSVRVGGGTGA
jgi:hypothetical protein